MRSFRAAATRASSLLSHRFRGPVEGAAQYFWLRMDGPACAWQRAENFGGCFVIWLSLFLEGFLGVHRGTGVLTHSHLTIGQCRTWARQMQLVLDISGGCVGLFPFLLGSFGRSTCMISSSISAGIFEASYTDAISVPSPAGSMVTVRSLESASFPFEGQATRAFHQPKRVQP